MKRCVYCKRRFKKDTEISFHRFPKDFEERKVWLQNMKTINWTPKTYDTLCSLHFDDKCFDKHFNRTTLIPGSSPTIFEGTMKIQTMNVTSDKDEMKEEYLDEVLLETIEQGIKKNNQIKSHNVTQDSSLYEEYLDVKPNIPRKENVEVPVPFIINGQHQGFFCNICKTEIYGFRYVCMQCADWDMCSSCEARSEHPAHYVLRLPAPRPYAEVQFAIDIVRREFVEKSPSEIRIKKEVDNDMFAELVNCSAKEPQITKNIPPIEKQACTPKANIVKPLDTTLKTKSPPIVRPPIFSTTQHIPIKKTTTAKSYFNNISRTNLHTKPSSMKDSNLKVHHKSTLETLPKGKFESIKKSSPVRKKPQMLKFILPRGMNSKHVLMSLQNGVRVTLDRLSEEAITQSKGNR